jgi:DNA-binding NarL/FixJ family response regulator
MARSALLIDDDPAFRILARRVLTSAGLDVIGEAVDVASGRVAASELRPDVILVDVGLPDGDGIQLAGELAKLPWRPRVVLTSVDPDAASDEEVLAIGAGGFAPKADLPGAGIALLLATS